MPTPRLIHPIAVFIRKAERALTAVQDENLHEPVGQVRRPQAPVKLPAQISWGTDEEQQPAEVGTNGASNGYVLFRTADLRAKHFAIEAGDRIVQIGEGAAAQQTDLYVTALKWLGHYPSARGATLVRAYFNDRSPSRQRLP